MHIRPATTRDARAIARVHVRGWQIGYRGLVPDAYLARLTVEDSMNRWLANLAEVQPMQTIVAEGDDEAIVGWAGFGANRDGLPSDVGELAGLYVDPDRWGEGFGGALLEAAEHGLCEAGYASAVLWTLEANDRTRRFYENRGWRPDGATDTHDSGAAVVRYVKSLAAEIDRSATGE